KYAVLVDVPHSIKYHLERAWHLAASGRPGPCWLDIPLDVQAAMVEESELSAYEPSEDDVAIDTGFLQAQGAETVERLINSERPVILAGTGVRCAGAIPEFRELVDLLGIPVTTAHTHDTIHSDHPFYCGRPGIFGQRAANFVVQNADLLLVLGSSLHLRQISYNYTAFAPRAFKIRVDIDPAELTKPLVPTNLPIQCDLKVFLRQILRQLRAAGFDRARHADWLAWSRERVRRYPPVQPHQREN